MRNRQSKNDLEENGPWKLRFDELTKQYNLLQKLFKNSENRMKIKTDQLIKIHKKMLRVKKLAAMGKLASIVGHELRGPLGTIKIGAFFLKLRLDKSTDEKVKDQLKDIIEEVDLCVTTIDNILGFARFKDLVRGDINVNTNIEAIMKKLTDGKNIEVILQLDTELPTLNADSVQIDQVLTNIILNAFQAMPEGGTLTVKTKQEKEFVVIECQDTGGGIKEENLDDIFEPLFTTKSKGTGLGLSVCQGIIEKHKGKIQVKSELGKGTTFTMLLPIQAGS